MAEKERVLERSEIEEQDRWAIEDLYATDEAWQEDLERLKSITQELAGCEGRLCASADSLLTYMRLSERSIALLEQLSNYAFRRNDEDTRVPKYQRMHGTAVSAFVALRSATAFETPELLALSEERLEAFCRERPELELYRRYFHIIRRKAPHTLSPAEERLLALAEEVTHSPQDVYAKFANADLRYPDATDADGESHPLNSGSFLVYLTGKDRVLRKSAFETLYGTLASYRNSVAAMLNAQLKALQFRASARRYDSPLEAALDHNEVPTSVYHNLIDAVHRNLDKLHRYVALRKKLLGVDELHYYDLYTPLIPDADVKIPFAQAKQTVYEALAPMGEKYRAVLRQGFDERWIDVYQNVGKRSGAYSAGAAVHPFVLLNYNGTLRSQFTLAHEMGHALHSYYSNKTQPTIYADYVIFVAEVASTCNESLLMQHLLGKTTDKAQRAYLINHFLEQFRGTLYRQTMFAEFELLIGELNRQGESLTAERMCEEYKKLNALYYGDGIFPDEGIAYEWERIPHFYYNYYVFQYATGFSAAMALSRKILKDGESAVRDYLRFLSSGSSKDPITLLKDAGVDMSTPEPVEQALALFGELLDEMEALTA